MKEKSSNRKRKVKISDETTTTPPSNKTKKAKHETSPEEYQPPPDEDKQFLINRLNALDPNPALKELASSENIDELVEEFFKSGGQLSTFTNALDPIFDDAVDVDLVDVFAACQSIVMCVVKHDDPKLSYGGRGFNFCMELVRLVTDDLADSLVNLISDKMTPSYKVKITLKLLTSMVTLGPEAAILILTKLDIGTPNWSKLLTRREKLEESDLRTCYIHFLLSFFIEPTPLVMKEYFERKIPLSAIFRGLSIDRHSLVLLVIDTLSTKVIQTLDVSKTNKIKIFSSFMLNTILNLSRWKGTNPENVNAVELEEIRVAAFDCLKLLLTSKKFGIRFQDSTYGCFKNSNLLIHAFFKHLETPWRANETIDLKHRIKFTAEVLAANPDQFAAYMSRLSVNGHLDPSLEGFKGGARKDRLQNWKNLASMLCDTYQHLDSQKLTDYNKDVSRVGIHVLGKILFSRVLLEKMIVPAMTVVEDCEVYGLSVKLFGIMINKTNSFKAIVSSEPLDAEFKKICRETLPSFHVLNNICCKELNNPQKLYLNQILTVMDLHMEIFEKEVGSIIPTIVQMLKKLENIGECKVEGDSDETIDPRVQLLLTVTKVLQSSYCTPESKSFLVKNITAKLFAILLNCGKSSNCAERETAKNILTSITEYCNACRQDKLDIHLFLNVGGCDTVEQKSRIFREAVTSSQSLLQEMNGYRIADMTISEADDILAALMKSDNVTEIGLEIKSIECFSPLIFCLLENKVLVEEDTQTKEVIRKVLECLIVATDNRQRLVQIIQEKNCVLEEKDVKKLGKLLKGKHLKDSLSWITADEWLQSSTLCKVVASKYIGMKDAQKLDECINQMDTDKKHSTVSFLFRQSLYQEFQLFSETVDDCVTVLLPYVDEFKIDCKAFAKVLLEDAAKAIAQPENKFSKERVLKTFQYVSFQEDDLISILELLSAQGVNMLIDDDNNLNDRGILLVAAILLLAKSNLQPEKFNLIKLSPHLEFLMEKNCESKLFEVVLKLINTHPHYADELSVNIVYVLVQHLSNEVCKQILVSLAQASSKLCSGLLEWVGKTKSETDDNNILALGVEMVNQGLVKQVTSCKKATKAFIKCAIHCLKSNLSDIGDAGDVNTSINIIRSLSTEICSSKSVTLVQQFFSEHKEELKSLLSQPTLAFSKKKSVVEFVYHIVLILDKVESNAKKLFLNYVLIPIIENIPQGFNKPEDKTDLIMMCDLGQTVAATQSYSAVFKYLKKNNECWITLIKTILKFGLKDPEVGVPTVSFLTTICRLRYSSSIAEEDWDVEDDEEMSHIVDMIISHSAYLKIILGIDFELKEKVVDLLAALAPASCRQDQVQVLLAGTTGKLKAADTAILRLLAIMESNGTVVNLKPPMMFGPPAVSLLMNDQSENTNKFSDCIGLLKQDIVMKTVAKFPNNLPLDPLADKCQDLGDHTDNLYDPRFVLPFVSSSTRHEVEIKLPFKLLESKVISLAVRALSSEHLNMRQIGYHVLHRFHIRIAECGFESEKKIWKHCIEVIRNGISRVDNTEKEDCMKLPGIITVFLARTFAIISNPVDEMYDKLCNFLCAKTYLPIFQVPEFDQLFNSTHSRDQRLHQMWILDVIRDGLQTLRDHRILVKDDIYKIILCKMTSSVCDKQILHKGLEILEVATRFDYCGLDLLKSLNILNWFNLLTSQITLDKEFELVLNIYENLNNSLRNSQIKNETVSGSLEQSNIESETLQEESKIESESVPQPLTDIVYLQESEAQLQKIVFKSNLKNLTRRLSTQTSSISPGLLEQAQKLASVV